MAYPSSRSTRRCPRTGGTSSASPVVSRCTRVIWCSRISCLLMLQVIASVGALQAMGASSESCCVAGPHACNCSTPRPLTSCWKRNGVGDLSLSLYSTFPSSFSLLKRGRSAGGSTLAAPPRVPAIPHSGAPCSMRPSGEIRPRARALRVRRDSRCGLPASPWSPAAATASTLLAPRTRLRRGPVCLLRLAQTRDANRQVKCASGMQSGAQHAREPLSACPSAHAWFACHSRNAQNAAQLCDWG